MTRKALGRGLRALIPEPAETSAGSISAEDLEARGVAIGLEHRRMDVPGGHLPGPPILEGVRQIPVDSIIPNQRQPRSDWDPEGMEQLTRSIAQTGLLEPILVRPKGDQYEIIAGERRWRACKSAGWREIPVLIREMEDRQSLEAALIENLQREDLNPVEEARAYDVLSSEYGLTHVDIAKRVSKDRSTVTNLMRLLKLPEPVLQCVSRGTLSAGHARVLLSLPADQQVSAAERFLQEKWSVRDAEAWAARVNEGMRRGNRPRGAKRSAPKPDHLRRIEEGLCRHFGTEAKIRLARQGGRVELRFHDEEELSRLLEQFGLVVF
ncbi:MAG: ParB/RepB/Spo0J family partition protein [Candidatus Eisenbacteria bacterium]